MGSRIALLLSGFSVIALGCGGDAFGGNDATTANGATGSGGATGTSSATTVTASTATSAQGTGGATSAGVGGAGGSLACPVVRGAYSVTDVGQGCADLDPTAMQCIRQPEGSCAIQFQSTQSENKPPAVNGKANLQMDGTFMGADITLGTQMRSGCTGIWNVLTQRMDVNCGGLIASAQMCTAKLTRTGACP